MEPRYSILLYGEDLAEYTVQIDQWLHRGIKVIWFGTAEEAEFLKKRSSEFSKAFLLQVYEAECRLKKIIIDGQDPEGFVSTVGKECPWFNAAQYRVEHCKEKEHIVVQASAGTGKTKVMVDRIMFLMHTIPELSMSEIYMITFTNDAADQMNRRLQEVLMQRFHLTGQMRYFRWMEEQSQMNISTIHSFAYSMLKEYGIGQSFTRNLTIQSLMQERKDLIRDVMDKHMDTSRSICSQIGIPLYKANTLIDRFWKKFSSIGISRRDMEHMEWGNASDNHAEGFQKLISTVVEELDDKYFEVKRKNDAIAVNDIMRDLQEVLTGGNLPTPDISMRFLFIDEFQDSDLSQIQVAVTLVKLLQARLFVVGDVKQSIYGFRGATDQAFDILDRSLIKSEIPLPQKFILVNNYRTAANIMNRMNDYFKKWGEDGLLKYDGPVVPFNRTTGTIQMIPGDVRPEIEHAIIGNVAAEYLDKLVEEVQASGRQPDEKKRVVMLTRTNNELTKLTEILQKRRIPVTIEKEGSFFTSEAVRDFYAMICSYMFADEPKYIFNYLLTPYAGDIQSMNVNTMEQFGGDYDLLVEYLGHFLEQTSWESYYKEFRLRPVLSVIKSILEQESVIDHFIVQAKRRKLDAGWEERRCAAAVRMEAIQYQANLEKLMELLRTNLGGEKVSLYDVYHYLQIQIATNRKESEPNVGSRNGYDSILCMTVHRSKGLEFDTVILPFTHRKFPSKYDTEIIIDPLSREAGWNFVSNEKNPDMRNDLYGKLKEQEIRKVRAEETRILYVAMTRAVNHLICIVHPPKDSDRWSYLLKEVGIDEE